MSAVIRILIVGVGSIGRRHLSNLKTISAEMPMVLAIVDTIDSNREAAKKLGADELYSSLDEALEDNSFDAALICTPNDQHFEQVCKVLKEEIHVFVEKPLCTDARNAGILANLAITSKRHVMVGCNLRFHSGVQTLSDALEANLIGRPLYARAWFAHYLPNWRPGQDYRQGYSAQAKHGGGILLDAVHEPDYLISLFGRVKEVNGQLYRQGDLDIDVEDTAMYTMKHSVNGGRVSFVSHVHVDFLRRDKARGCEICGTAGTLVWRSNGKNPEHVNVRLYSASTDMWTDLYANEAYDPNCQYLDELRYFLNCLEKVNPVPINGPIEAGHVLDVLDAVRKSSVVGRNIQIVSSN